MRGACPLCGEPRDQIAKLGLVDLISAYRRRFGIDVAQLFGDSRSLSLLQCEGCGLAGFEPAVTGDEEFYKGMSKWWGDRLPEVGSLEQRPDYKRVLHHIKPSDDVLEIGGAGLLLPRHLPDPARYVGLELNPSEVEKAVANGIDMRTESVEDHARSNANRYDVVCHVQVIEHVAAPGMFLDACVACLKPGGRLIVACPNNRSFLALEPDNILNMPPHHVSWFSRKPLEWIAEHWRLRVVDIVEEPLEPDYHREFARLLWLHAAGRLWRNSEFFTLDGARFRMADMFARGMARATAPLFKHVASAIPGHTITAVYKKS